MASKYPAEFKQQALTLAAQKSMTHREISEMLGISRATLSAWLRQQRIDQGQVPAGPGEMTTLEKQQAAEIHKLRQEVDILKKATAYFAGALAPK